MRSMAMQEATPTRKHHFLTFRSVTMLLKIPQVLGKILPAYLIPMKKHA